jgi:ribosome-associated translation inhibitor RaiA
MEMFDTNKSHYDINTRHNMDIHMTQVNLAIYGTGEHHMAVRIYNALPNTLKEISNDIKRFKHKLKEFLFLNAFYSLDEFFMIGFI